MLINIQVDLRSSYSQEVRIGTLDKRDAVETAVSLGHFIIMETIDEGEEND